MIERSTFLWLCSLVALTVVISSFGTTATAQSEDEGTPPATTSEEDDPSGDTANGETTTEESTSSNESADSSGSKTFIGKNWKDLGTASWLKIVPVMLLVLLWMLTGDWVNRSTQIHGFNYTQWNSIILFPFVVSFVILVMVPLYAVGITLLTLSYFGPLFAYTAFHNKSVEQHQKVFTSDWFRHIFGMGEPTPDYEKGAPVDLTAYGGDESTNQGNLITARQSPGYLLVKEMVADMSARRTNRVVLDFTQGGVATKYLVDGVWHNGEAREREASDVMLAVMKQLANLDITERRKKQQGKFGAKYEDVSYLVPIVSQGTKTGERVLLELLGGNQAKLLTYDDLGMRDKIQDQWSEIMAQDEGLVVISAPPEGGLTTLTDVSIMETDRLMRDFVAIEDVNHPERDIENVVLHTFDSKKGESPAKLLPELIRTYPNVYVVRDLVDKESAKLLFQEVEDNHLVVTTAPALEAPEALLRILQKKVPHKEFAQTVTAVLCTRLIRCLCEDCKVAYEPSPQLLQKLGIPAGKVEQLYQPPKPEEQEKPCESCGNFGYKGRTGLFELLIVNDKVREVLIKQPKLDTLRKAARLAGMRTFQEEAILLVAKGVTSIAEAQRILKGA